MNDVPAASGLAGTIPPPAEKQREEPSFEERMAALPKQNQELTKAAQGMASAQQSNVKLLAGQQEIK